MSSDRERAIEQAIEQSDYRYYGLRRMTDAAAPEVGAVLSPSYAWEDGDCTGELLDGTCATRIPESAGGARLALEQADRYRGPLVVIGSDYLGDGVWPTASEPMQASMRDAVVVAVIKE